MDGVRARFGRGRKDFREVQITGGRSVTAQGVCLVCRADVQGIPVGLRVDSYAPDPGVPTCTGNTDSNLATVGDEHLAHGTVIS
jgi:hypothetical protein